MEPKQSPTGIVPIDDEIDLRDYWDVIRRRGRLIVAVLGFIVAIGLLYVFLLTPQFRGETTVLVEENSPSQLAMFGFAELAGPVAVETEMELLRSRSVAGRVVRELGLDAVMLSAPFGSRLVVRDYDSQVYPRSEYPYFRVRFLDEQSYEVIGPKNQKLGKGELGKSFASALEKVSWTLELAGPRQATYEFHLRPFEHAVRDLRERMTVAEVGKKTNIIRISVEFPDPFLASQAADHVAKAYIEENVARKSVEATKTLEFLEQQLEALRGNLEDGERKLDEFKAESGIFILGETAAKLIDQISRMEIAHAEVQLQQRHYNGVLELLSNAKENDEPFLVSTVGIQDPVLTELISNLSMRLVELRTLRQDLTDASPKVAVVRAQVEEIKAKVKTAVGNSKTGIDNRLATIGKIIEGYENQLKRLPQAERELAGLTRRSTVNAELYTFLLKKHEEARIQRAGIVGNVRLIDASLIPETPVSPKKKQALGIILLLGLSLAVGFAFVVEYLDDSLKTPDDVDRYLGLNLYGVIPYCETPVEQPITLPTLDPRSPIQEAFRSLRTNIQFGSSARKLQTILCSSATPGAGKSTTTVNLAHSLAQGGASVLVIDCDLRRPQLHRFFGGPYDLGLTNIVGGGQALEQLIRKSDQNPNLFFITSGPIPPNPAEMLASPRFHEVLQAARERFDYILIDTPPVIAFTDAVVVAAQMDAVFIVVELGRSSGPLVKRSLELLHNVKANIAGVIVNKAQHKAGGGYYYGYSYGYGSEYAPSSEMPPLRNWFVRLLGWIGLSNR